MTARRRHFNPGDEDRDEARASAAGPAVETIVVEIPRAWLRQEGRGKDRAEWDTYVPSERSRRAEATLFTTRDLRTSRDEDHVPYVAITVGYNDNYTEKWDSHIAIADIRDGAVVRLIAADPAEQPLDASLRLVAGSRNPGDEDRDEARASSAPPPDRRTLMQYVQGSSTKPNVVRVVVHAGRGREWHVSREVSNSNWRTVRLSDFRGQGSRVVLECESGITLKFMEIERSGRSEFLTGCRVEFRENAAFIGGPAAGRLLRETFGVTRDDLTLDVVVDGVVRARGHSGRGVPAFFVSGRQEAFRAVVEVYPEVDSERFEDSVFGDLDLLGRLSRNPGDEDRDEARTSSMPGRAGAGLIHVRGNVQRGLKRRGMWRADATRVVVSGPNLEVWFGTLHYTFHYVEHVGWRCENVPGYDFVSFSVHPADTSTGRHGLIKLLGPSVEAGGARAFTTTSYGGSFGFMVGDRSIPFCDVAANNRKSGVSAAWGMPNLRRTGDVMCWHGATRGGVLREWRADTLEFVVEDSPSPNPGDEDRDEARASAGVPPAGTFSFEARNEVRRLVRRVEVRARSLFLVLADGSTASYGTEPMTSIFSVDAPDKELSVRTFSGGRCVDRMFSAAVVHVGQVQTPAGAPAGFWVMKKDGHPGGRVTSAYVREDGVWFVTRYPGEQQAETREDGDYLVLTLGSDASENPGDEDRDEARASHFKPAPPEKPKYCKIRTDCGSLKDWTCCKCKRPMCDAHGVHGDDHWCWDCENNWREDGGLTRLADAQWESGEIPLENPGDEDRDEARASFGHDHAPADTFEFYAPGEGIRSVRQVEVRASSVRLVMANGDVVQCANRPTKVLTAPPGDVLSVCSFTGSHFVDYVFSAGKVDVGQIKMVGGAHAGFWATKADAGLDDRYETTARVSQLGIGLATRRPDEETSDTREGGDRLIIMLRSVAMRRNPGDEDRDEARAGSAREPEEPPTAGRALVYGMLPGGRRTTNTLSCDGISVVENRVVLLAVGKRRQDQNLVVHRTTADQPRFEFMGQAVDGVVALPVDGGLGLEIDRGRGLDVVNEGPFTAFEVSLVGIHMRDRYMLQVKTSARDPGIRSSRGTRISWFTAEGEANRPGEWRDLSHTVRKYSVTVDLDPVVWALYSELNEMRRYGEESSAHYAETQARLRSVQHARAERMRSAAQPDLDILSRGIEALERADRLMGEARPRRADNQPGQ